MTEKLYIDKGLAGVVEIKIEDSKIVEARTLYQGKWYPEVRCYCPIPPKS